jgi:hypothetical protein
MGKSRLHDQVVSPYITQLYYENCKGKVVPLVMLNYLLWTLQVDMHDSMHNSIHELHGQHLSCQVYDPQVFFFFNVIFKLIN